MITQRVAFRDAARTLVRFSRTARAEEQPDNKKVVVRCGLSLRRTGVYPVTTTTAFAEDGGDFKRGAIN